MRVMGVDPGSRRIGLALSDEDGELASPLAVIEGGSGDAAARRVVEQAARHEVTTIVLGLPLRMNGSEGDSARRARALGRALEAAGLCVVYWDERLTSQAAARALREQGVRAHQQRGRLDQHAAAILLQSYLDAERERVRSGR